MWWLVFTAIDLYLGVVIIDTLARGDSVSEEKRDRLVKAKKVTLVLFGLTVLGIFLKLVARNWM
jgi:hypothetical protein